MIHVKFDKGVKANQGMATHREVRCVCGAVHTVDRRLSGCVRCPGCGGQQLVSASTASGTKAG